MQLKKIFTVPRDHFRKRGFRGLRDLFACLMIRKFPNYFLHHGKNQVFCPICQWSGSQFLPFRAADYIDFNEECPQCHTGKKHRWHYFFYTEIRKMAEQKGTLLFIAPELGILNYLRSIPQLTIKTADLFMENMDYCFDLIKSPLPDESFDFIICNHVIEHTSDDRQAMRELARMLKKNGELIFSVPVEYDLDKTIDFGKPMPMMHFHYYRYGKDFFERVPTNLKLQKYICHDHLTPEQCKSMVIFLKNKRI